MQSTRYSILFLCLILSTLVLAVTSLVEKRCVEGMNFDDGCNNCMCAQGRLVCTRAFCTIWSDSLQMHVPKPTLKPPANFWEAIENVPPPCA